MELTVCQISRNNAETRIKAILEGKKTAPAPIQPPSDQTNDEENIATDVQQYAEDRVREHIEQKFKGHSLVQVKSSSGPVNVEVIQRLHGSTKSVGRSRPWGGFIPRCHLKNGRSFSAFAYEIQVILSEVFWRTTISFPRHSG
ncbi:MAG: hypothetical protein M3Z32_06390, partial [Acidobacteriota bacterium]|nr:hypothetical protein [Acidobacteriota bacterium]